MDNTNLYPQDPVFGVNSYNKPKVLSPLESLVRNILMVLFGKPGFYPSIPDLGMDITKYLYMFEDEIDTGSIKDELVAQCSEFLPEVESGTFDVTLTHQNGRIVLLFKLPVIIDDRMSSVVLGVTTNSKGELVYQYTNNSITQFI